MQPPSNQGKRRQQKASGEQCSHQIKANADSSENQIVRLCILFFPYRLSVAIVLCRLSLSPCHRLPPSGRAYTYTSCRSAKFFNSILPSIPSSNTPHPLLPQPPLSLSNRPPKLLLPTPPPRYIHPHQLIVTFSKRGSHHQQTVLIKIVVVSPPKVFSLMLAYYNIFNAIAPPLPLF
jgi:hypothetical protein